MTAERVEYLAELALESGSTPAEGELAEQYVRAHSQDYDDYDFQKRVGEGQPLPPGEDPKWAAVWRQATRKRVDLVGYSDAGATLIEAKEQITWAAVRQLLDYAELWRLAPADPPVARLVIIGRAIDPGVAERASQSGIQVELFPGLGTS